MESERTATRFAYQYRVGWISSLDDQIVRIAPLKARCNLPYSRGCTSCDVDYWLLEFRFLQLADLVSKRRSTSLRLATTLEFTDAEMLPME
jgi:hypothetical protein